MNWLWLLAAVVYFGIGAMFADADRPDKYRKRSDSLYRLFAWPIYYWLRSL